MIAMFRQLPRLGSGSQHLASIDDVPWYRRESAVSLFVLSGFFCVPPLLWIACVLCLTGDIYRNKIGVDGKLIVWTRLE